MKHINEAFEDHEHKQLKKAKGKKSWHDFIMELAP
jgi:predicted CopG family antitoxin